MPTEATTTQAEHWAIQRLQHTLGCAVVALDVLEALPTIVEWQTHANIWVSRACDVWVPYGNLPVADDLRIGVDGKSTMFRRLDGWWLMWLYRYARTCQYYPDVEAWALQHHGEQAVEWAHDLNRNFRRGYKPV